MIQDRLKALRSEMAKRGISLYVVPTADFHESEYVGEHFKARKYITGFTGSAGTAVITMDEAGLWTDGRYFAPCGIYHSAVKAYYTAIRKSILYILINCRYALLANLKELYSGKCRMGQKTFRNRKRKARQHVRK